MPPVRPPFRRPRRAVLRSVGLASLAALAGCAGGDADPTSTPTDAGAGTPTDRAATTDPPTGSPATGAATDLSDVPPTRRFDFWAGEWTPRGGGTAAVYPLLGDRLLLDAYGAPENPSALSMTFYHAADDRWVRRFLDRQGNLVRLAGGLDGGSMVLVGDRVDADGELTSMRATWTPVDADVVRHTLETGGEGEDGWTTTFDATYDREGDAPAYPAPTAEAVPDSATAIGERPPRRQFDFWVDEWDVFSGSSRVGGSVVERRLDGNLVLENWAGRGGSTGKSFNYHDPSTGEWTQNWVAGNGSIVEMRGGVVDGAMRLVGEQVSTSGVVTDYRGIFTPLEDGAVRQELQTSDDGGETWNPGFTGIYRPAE